MDSSILLLALYMPIRSVSSPISRSGVIAEHCAMLNVQSCA